MNNRVYTFVARGAFSIGSHEFQKGNKFNAKVVPYVQDLKEIYDLTLVQHGEDVGNAHIRCEWVAFAEENVEVK